MSGKHYINLSLLYTFKLFRQAVWIENRIVLLLLGLNEVVIVPS